jgi:signal transduction histidine kinase
MNGARKAAQAQPAARSAGQQNRLRRLIDGQRRLRESEQQMRQLAARVEHAREEERARIARELHDELGQTLTALKLELGRAAAELRQERATLVEVDRVQALIGHVEIALATVKRISTGLRPPTLDHLGLAAAIRWEAMAFGARTGLRCRVRANRQTCALTPEQQTVLFRIVQETLTNIARHARASAVQIALNERRGRFELRIQDNGRGITAAEIADPRSIGLLGMRERVALIGGTFGIAGRHGKGTTVAVRIRPARPKRAAARRQPAPRHSR